MFGAIKTLGLSLILATGLSVSAAAQDVPAPSGEVLLTVSGDIAVTNVDDTLQLDRAALAAIDTTSFETTTIWTEGTHRFEGVSLAAFAAFIGVDSGNLLATAINDYTVEIPLTDAVANGPIIAHLMDGEEMSVREKGPLWIIYPYDRDADFRTKVIFSRSIWQLDRIEVVQ